MTHLLARPNEPLLDHLRGVGQLAEAFLKPLDLGPLGRLAGLCHDLGKATPYFQEMIQGKRRKDPYTWHALPRALFAAWAATERGYQRSEALSLFLVVLAHHSSLKTPWEAFPSELISKKRFPKQGAWGVLEAQLEALKTEAFQKLVLALGLSDPMPFLEGGALEMATKLAEEANDLFYSEGDLALHFRTALLYSALLDADRRLAGQAGLVQPGLPLVGKPKPIPAWIVEKRLETERLEGGLPKVAPSELTKVFPYRGSSRQPILTSTRKPSWKAGKPS